MAYTQGQDWEEIVIRKKKAPAPKSNEEAQRLAIQQGAQIETVKKFTAAKNVANKQDVNARKLESADDSEDSLTHNRVSLSVGIKIQQARNALHLTQKELATKINEKPNVINDYEAGRAIPSNQVLSKLERALNVKLRGK